MCLRGIPVLFNGFHVQAETYLQGEGREKPAMLFWTFVDGTEPKILELYSLSCELIIFEVYVKECWFSKSSLHFLANLNAVIFYY